jgi:hypothetical protein
MKQAFSKSNGERQHPTRRPRQWFWLPLFLILAWAGCEQAPKIAADINPAGTYTLVSVDGNNVPYTLTHEGVTPTIKSGVFIINNDGTCSSKVVFSLPSRDNSSRDVKATYTRQGPTLTMQWEGAGVTMGIVESHTFTMTNEGMVFVYRK